MKIIFLDVDGVLNSEQDRFSWTIESDKHLILLACIVRRTDAKIVVSSSWRNCSLLDTVNYPHLTPLAFEVEASIK